jgi:hypothetical protein
MRVEHVVLGRRYEVVEESPSYYVVRPETRPWVVDVVKKEMVEIVEDWPVEPGVHA